MSESTDQPVVDAQPGAAAGVAADTPATTNPNTAANDIDTDAFDRMEAPDEDEEGEADSGQSGASAAQSSAVQAPNVDDEEVELSDGRKVKVPKEVALGNLRQADYTKKTQELAEKVRAFEAERNQQIESMMALRGEHAAISQREASLSAIEKELSEYQKYTPEMWAKTKNENPPLFQQHADRLDFLRIMRVNEKEALAAAKADLKAKETSLSQKRAEADEASLRDAWTKANATLAKDIPDWGAEKFKEIGQFAMKEFGITAEQLQQSPDPVAWKMANRLMKAEARVAQLEKAQAQKTVVDRTVQSAEVKPAAQVAGGNAKPRGATDNLGMAEWMARRNAQVSRKAGR